MKKKIIWIVVAVIVLGAIAFAITQRHHLTTEHPTSEHPTKAEHPAEKGSKAEHPTSEHPK
jgi:hypothetical protein